MRFKTIFVCLGIWTAGAGAAVATDPPAIWIDVPFVSQSRDGCGSAVISMVMQYWAKQNAISVSAQMDAAKIQRLLYSPQQKGIPASAMQNYFREQGFRAFAFRGEWSDLEHHLREGRPLIVSLKASGERGPLHYSVVVGLDPARGYVFLNDPALGKMNRISREGCLSEWNSANNWMLLAVPAGQK